MSSIPMDTQQIAELVAALQIGNQHLHSTAVDLLRADLIPMLESDIHYLFLRNDDDRDSFFGCGTAHGAADTMEADGCTLRLYAIPLNECPNCKPDEEEDENDA